MLLNLEAKEKIVAEVKENLLRSHSVIAAEYKGLSVADMTALRFEARKTGVRLRVVRNTLVRRAVQGTDFECLQDGLKGQLLLAFSEEDPGGAARIIAAFMKSNDKLAVRLVAFGGRLMDPSELSLLATMPTYDESISLLMAVMKAPMDKFARTLAEPTAKLVRTIAAVRDQKEAA